MTDHSHTPTPPRQPFGDMREPEPFYRTPEFLRFLGLISATVVFAGVLLYIVGGQKKKVVAEQTAAAREAMLPKLLERTGTSPSGSITALYTILVQAGDMDEPIADEVRGILDGHIVLDRQIAARGHYPAVDAVSSLSRVMDQVVLPAQVQAARRVRSALALYEQKRDLIALGAYEKGSDPRLDQTLLVLPELERFLCQDAQLSEPFEHTRDELLRLARKLA